MGVEIETRGEGVTLSPLASEFYIEAMGVERLERDLDHLGLGVQRGLSQED